MRESQGGLKEAKARGLKVTPRNKATKASEVVESESTAIVPKEISGQIRFWQTIGLSMDDSKEISKNYSL